MNTIIITVGVIVIALISVLLLISIMSASNKVDRIESTIKHHLIDIYNRQSDIHDNISCINNSITDSTKEIHTQLKSIIELNNGIKEDNKELVENYQKICDDLATIITTINEKKTTRRVKRLDDGCGKHKCKCHEENNSQQISKEDTNSKIGFKQEANR